MKNNTNLSTFGFSKYYLSIDGRLYKINPAQKELKKDKSNRFYLIADDGTEQRKTLKELYRYAYNREFSIDTIEDLPAEQWKSIENTKGRYLISNCGRVKSLCGYTTKILSNCLNNNGYLIVSIERKNYKISRLVAFAFCENKYQGQNVQIHHKDRNRQNNYFTNLEILTAEEHLKEHRRKETADNEKILSSL